MVDSGAFASVRLATDSPSRRQVACKVMKRAKIDKGFHRQIQHEIDILADLDHVRLVSRAGRKQQHLNKLSLAFSA